HARRGSESTYTSCPRRCPPPRQHHLFPYTTLFRSRVSMREDLYSWLTELTGEVLSTDGNEGLSPTEAIEHWEADHRRRVARVRRSEEHTSELQSRFDLVCRLLLEKKKKHDGEISCS